MKASKALATGLLALGLLAALGGVVYWYQPQSQSQNPKGPAPAAEIIDRFYRDYFRHYQTDPQQKTKGPTPPFSSGFIASLKQNAQVCSATAVEEPCGWGAGGDVYFQSQEYDPALTYESSRIKISELNPGEVRASFNVYPSDTKAGTFYDRTLVYKLVQAEGKWVVDDILVDGKSMRHEMEEETRAFSKLPTRPSGANKTQ